MMKPSDIIQQFGLETSTEEMDFLIAADCAEEYGMPALARQLRVGWKWLCRTPLKTALAEKKYIMRQDDPEEEDDDIDASKAPASALDQHLEYFFRRRDQQPQGPFLNSQQVGPGYGESSFEGDGISGSGYEMYVASGSGGCAIPLPESVYDDEVVWGLSQRHTANDGQGYGSGENDGQGWMTGHGGYGNKRLFQHELPTGSGRGDGDGYGDARMSGSGHGGNLDDFHHLSRSQDN